jgi:hypothetical protein
MIWLTIALAFALGMAIGFGVATHRLTMQAQAYWRSVGRVPDEVRPDVAAMADRIFDASRGVSRDERQAAREANEARYAEALVLDDMAQAEVFRLPVALRDRLGRPPPRVDHPRYHDHDPPRFKDEAYREELGEWLLDLARVHGGHLAEAHGGVCPRGVGCNLCVLAREQARARAPEAAS